MERDVPRVHSLSRSRRQVDPPRLGLTLGGESAMRATAFRIAFISVGCGAILGVLSGCAPGAGMTAPALAPATTTGASVRTEPTPSVETSLEPTVSSDSIDYALSLGGSSHLGETLYLVVGASVDTEGSASSALEAAIPRFGDMQSYFIVQRSDNFHGLQPGSWVVIEAYRDKPSTENLQFGRRGFPAASVERATVATEDPIPVFEDMVADD